MPRSQRLVGGLLALGLLAGCLAAAGPAAAAAGDLPRLQAGIPAGVEAVWFDDHSLGGDDHLSWSAPDAVPYSNDDGQASGLEPQELRFRSTITNTGAGGLQLCSYAVPGSPGWMRTYQLTPGALAACPASAPAGAATGWARYVVGGHSTAHAFNRWHVMDLERFALVPVDHPSAPTVWDSAWGSCMDLGGGVPDCPTDAGATSLSSGIAAGATTVTQDSAPDEQIIPIGHDLAKQLPDGRYQLVDIVNPYGIVAEAGTEAGSVSCVDIDFRTRHDAGFEGLLVAEQVPGTPATCLLPTTVPAAVSPAGRDPMADSFVDPCLVGANGHCWSSAPHMGPFRPARTNATGTPTATATRTVPQGSALDAVTPPVAPSEPVTSTPSAPAPPAAPAAVAGEQPVTLAVTPPATIATPVLPTLALRTARGQVRTALRRTYGHLPASASVACVSASRTAARCSVAWRASGATYRGTVRVRLAAGPHATVRWSYDLAVRRTLAGRVRTTTRTDVRGGTL